MRRFVIFLLGALLSAATTGGAAALPSVPSIPAAADYPFIRIRTGRESANFDVRCITRDSDGFVWFGTSLGLLRYDGQQTVMPTDPDPASPLNGYINTIQEDADGRLWVRVNDEYYFVYDRLTHRCRTDIGAILGNGAPASPDHIYIDEDKNIWLISDEGTGRIDSASGEYIAVRFDRPQADKPVRIVRSGDRAYLLHISGAVDIVDVRSMRTGPDITPPRKTFQTEAQGFWKIFADSRSDIWITDSYDGVWRCRAGQDTWEHFSETDGAARLSNNRVLDLAEDGDGRIWIATDHGGIDICDPATGRITLLEYDSYDNTSLASNSVYSISRDAEDNIWVGHYKHGISLYSPARRNSFMRHIRRLLDNNRHDDINSICEDKAGDLWFGTNEFGIVRLNRTTGEERAFRSGDGLSDLGSDVVVSLFCDTRGRVWAGTYQGGLSCWDGGRMRRYRHREGDPRSLADDSVWDIDEDCDGNIWIGTMSGGVQRFVPETDDFDTFTAEKDGLLSNYILDLACDRGRELYISSVNGIVALNVRTLGCREVLAESGSVKMNICRDSRGLLWIVDRLGDLTLYDTNKGRFTGLDRNTMPPAVRSIVEGYDKTLWMSTDNGIYNVRVTPDDRTGDYIFTVYGHLRQEENRRSVFNFRSAALTSRGEIIFGGVNGWCVTDPTDVGFGTGRAADPPRGRFTSLKINHVEIHPGDLSGGRPVLTQDIGFTDRIDLHHREHSFSLTFSPMNFPSPFNIEYFYKLEGFSNEWLPVDNGRSEMTFTNLDPGQYRLRIRAAHADGIFGDDAASLTVVIRPPFWRTDAARALCTLLLIVAAGTAAWQVQRRQKRKFEQRQARIEAEYKNRLNDMKISFFTNVSHDFRTLLSLIISPLGELRSRFGEREEKTLDVVYRNAQRLLQLVNQLLDFRKLDMNGLSLNPSHGNLAAFVREICSSFELLTEDSRISLETEFGTDWIDCDFDRDKMSKVLVNLLSNAFKYTDGDGSVKVVLRTEEDGSRVVIEVRDTGIGIPDAEKDRIFDRFYQVGHGDAGSGSGLGLHIVQEFVSLHGGTVSVHDNVPHGSIFRVVLPVCREEEEDTAEQGSGADPSAGEGHGAEGSGRSTILIAEDNADFRRFVRDCFATDYEILEAADGAEALEILRDHAVDLVVSDIMMPRMDGLELCRRIKEDIATSHIPLILLTARSMQEQEIEGLSGGADDYIVKPVNISVLRLRIMRLLKWTRQSRERFSEDPAVSPDEITITSLDERLITQARSIVMENIGNPDFSVEELSSRLGMHRTHLYKKLTFITGKSPLEFIRIIRLKRAAELLSADGSLNVSEVAYMVGFNSPKVFARHFREMYACSPREWQRGAGASA